MTEAQKKRITEMRRQGRGYAEIADAVKLPQGTVKSFCWRNQIANANLSDKSKPSKNGCRNCGCVLEKKADAPPRKFCSDQCRNEWWGKNRKPNNSAVCACCHKEFSYYGKTIRKYCSHDCFIKDRFGEVPHD